MKLTEFIKNLSDGVLTSQNADGAFPPGHNGPYHDPETPLRNTSHWLITLAYIARHSSEPNKYISHIKRAAEFLNSQEARPFGYSFHHRKGNNKNKCNGLIGQAWTIEALAEAAAILENPEYTTIAEALFLQHRFNERYGLWNQLEIDGTILPIDKTFNHQLWFAASGASLAGEKRKKIKDRLTQFMDHLPENLTILENGLIFHKIARTLFYDRADNNLSFKLKKSIKLMLRKLPSYKNRQRRHTIYKSVGYHAFNMYAFARLEHQMPEHPFWHSPTFEKTTHYMRSANYKDALDDNKYGFPYNPPGFEIPLALASLTDMQDDKRIAEIKWWLEEQIEKCYNLDEQALSKNTEDPATLTARIYELTRLPNEILTNLDIDIS